MAESKAVAEKKATLMTTFDDSLLSGGTGLEENYYRGFRDPLY